MSVSNSSSHAAILEGVRTVAGLLGSGVSWRLRIMDELLVIALGGCSAGEIRKVSERIRAVPDCTDTRARRLLSCLAGRAASSSEATQEQRDAGLAFVAALTAIDQPSPFSRSDVRPILERMTERSPHASLSDLLMFHGEFTTPAKRFAESIYRDNMTAADRAFLDRLSSIRSSCSPRPPYTQPSEGHVHVRKSDRECMRIAVDEAKKCVPEDARTHPRVGVVLVRDGVILATAFRGEGEPGRHAEFVALEVKLKDEVVADATLFTTLEPCTARNHPKIPCAERISERRIRRVIIGMLDPNGRVLGRGERSLCDSGIEVGRFDGDLAREIEDLNREFNRYCQKTPS